MAGHEDTLRRLSLSDEQTIGSVLGIQVGDLPSSGLDPKTHALVRLGALMAQQASSPSYHWDVDAAVAAGAAPDEILGVLIAIAPIVGIAPVVSAAPKLALALGYDVEAAFEELGDVEA